MTLEEIKVHPLFRQLTDKQQLFVEHYVHTQELAESTKAAGYNCKDEVAYERMGRKNLRNPIIKQLIAKGLNYDPMGGMLTKAEVMLLLSEHLRKCTSHEAVFLRMAALFSELKGWTGKGSQVPDISEAVKAVEEKIRVTNREQYLKGNKTTKPRKVD